MTCKHVLDFIDAGPLVDVSAAQRDAVQQHARDCAACARAIQSAEAIASDLRSLAQPAPPELTAAVMAAIARIEPNTDAPGGARERSVGVTSVAALASGLTILVATVLTSIAGSGVRLIGAGIDVPATAAATFALAAGLVLYVGGLFAPVGRALRR